MPFPRIPEILANIMLFLDNTDLKSARLVAKDFAKLGAQWLFRHIQYSLTSSSRDGVYAISRHPFLCRHVRSLNYQFDRGDHCPSPEDPRHLLSSFPLLTYLQSWLWDDLIEPREGAHWQSLSGEATEAHALIYNATKLEKLVELNLLINDPGHGSMRLPSCFSKLRRLHLEVNYKETEPGGPSEVNIFQGLPNLDWLRVSAKPSEPGDINIPVLSELPSTLLVLYLDNFRLSSNFVLPPVLKKLCLQSARLLGRHLVRWATILEKFRGSCLVVGQLTAELDGDSQTGEYRDSEDQVLGSTFEECLYWICYHEFPSDIRGALLEELFNGQCERLAPDLPGELRVSDELAIGYHEAMKNIFKS